MEEEEAETASDTHFGATLSFLLGFVLCNECKGANQCNKNGGEMRPRGRSTIWLLGVSECVCCVSWDISRFQRAFQVSTVIVEQHIHGPFAASPEAGVDRVHCV